MSLTESFLIWIISFLVVVGILYISYKISYKLGIKKALYRTSYIMFSIISAFVLAPLINDELFNFDLSKVNITLYYKDGVFHTLIDYIEEVIVHNEFLNDMYKYFPSLKDLLMDFPQIVLVPVTYLMLFIVFMVVWMPLYLYLSYKRKRRVLYDREDKKSHRVWAGVLGCFQAVFLISIILSPLNGISRIYKNATSDTLDGRSSLCDENEVLKKYKVYCDVLEVYNSTAFATIGSNKSVSHIVFDSLTRISYDDGYTSFSKEAYLIIKSGIVLNQSGLLTSVLESSDTIPVASVVENNLNDEDIDIIVETLSESRYSEDLLIELGALISNTLNGLMQTILNDETFTVEYTIVKEDIINEIKVVLKALTVLANSSLLDDIIVISERIMDFVYGIPSNRKDHVAVLNFMVDMFNSIDLDELEAFADYLFESKIFNKIMPYIIDRGFGIFGFNFVANQGDVKVLFDYALEFARAVKRHQPSTFFELINQLDDNEMRLFADIAEILTSRPEYKGLIQFILSEIFGDLGLEVYFPSEFLTIENWDKEVYVLKKICALASKAETGESVSLNDVMELISDKDSEAVQIMMNLVKYNSSFFLSKLILAIGK